MNFDMAFNFSGHLEKLGVINEVMDDYGDGYIVIIENGTFGKTLCTKGDVIGFMIDMKNERGDKVCSNVEM
jgi:hypothetical protein